jgi:hypothetical protein
MIVRKDATVFWEIIDRTQAGCWPYPERTFAMGATEVPVCRFAYEVARGPLSKWDDVATTCGTERCVRPEHLERQVMKRFPANAAVVPRVRR